MRALVVDDSRAARSLIGRMLRELGFDVVDAAQGVEAMEHLVSGTPFDLAVVDWNMPTMNGLDFVRTARADARFQEVPIVMCTSETEIQQMIRALEAGANEYIMKPFTAEILRGKLELIGLSLV
ncbi:MAG: response regulator [Gemmatimonadaceae bacterium]